MASAHGVVYLPDTQIGVANATVRAVPHDGEIRVVHTDANGLFQFLDLAPGQWSFVAVADGNRASRPWRRVLATDNDSAEISLELNRNMTVNEWRVGVGFLTALIVLLAVLVAGYVLLHRTNPVPAEPLSPTIATLAEQALHDLDTNTQALTTTVPITVALIGNTLDAVFTDQPRILSELDKQILTEMVNGVEQSALAGDEQAVKDRLERLRLLTTMPTPASYFWGQLPWRLLEVYAWALAGILVNLIVTVGSYLRWKRFYREGLPQHVAQIIAIPLLVVVVMLILSLTTLRLTVAGGMEAQLDLNDPNLLVAVSFLLASKPWEVIRFVQSSAERLLRTDTAAPSE